MKAKEKVRRLYEKLDAKFLEQFGFNMRNVTFDKIVDYMYAPKDPSSLAITRILFGFMMLLDIPVERAAGRLDRLVKEPNLCQFPLIPVLQPVPMPYMALVYIALWFGAVGIMLGYKFHLSGPLFTACYWYLFLIEKSYWNNHSYLFGLVALLISCTDAASYWSVDTYLDPSKKKTSVPYWNYFILKYQFFILYFMAGLKKSGAEWLTGYSLPNLSEHWVFLPFRYFLTVSQTDFLVVHLFVFVFDLTVAIWMMWAPTRHVAMLFCALFHLMNSRLFSIGMFPWVCLATMPLFYSFDWPRRVAYYFRTYHTKIYDCVHGKIGQIKQKHICECKSKVLNKDINSHVEESGEKSKKCETDSSDSLETAKSNKVDETTNNKNEIIQTESKDLDGEEKHDSNRDNIRNDDEITFKELATKKDCRKKTTICVIALYVFIQAFLPYSHFITKGYNNWDEGLYGYSWNMMVHSWSDVSTAVKVLNNNNNQEMFIDPNLYTPNTRWITHGDMVYQYAHCLKRILEKQAKETKCDDASKLPNNISIYVDIWLSLNGRFTQRIFDPKVDILKATWSPFSRVPFLMPLLDDAIHWRKELAAIREEVYSWNNSSDVKFFADFPGYENEKFIPAEFKNVTLTILEGTVVYEEEVPKNRIGRSFMVTAAEKINITPGLMHKITNIGKKPAFYMYTFFVEPQNATEPQPGNSWGRLSSFSGLYKLMYSYYHFSNTVISALFEMLKFSQCN